MLRRRKRADFEQTPASAPFRRVLAQVEEAKATLLLGIPSGRSPRLPMAEALMGFEQGLAAARSEMDRWRTPQVETAWVACDEALRVALARAERLRLQAPSDAYEDLVPILDGLLDPLDAFPAAAEMMRRPEA